MDEIERIMLNRVICVQESRIKRLGFVEANSPQSIFQEVPWMSKDEKVVKYLWNHAKKIHFEAAEYVCLEDEIPDGVYVIISGESRMIFYLPHSSNVSF